MRVIRERQSVLSFKVTKRYRRLVELLAADLTVNTGRRQTMTDVVELAIQMLADRRKIKLED